ncbi:MAG: hypothetical protein WCF36_04355 [Candidatus Nanopelagicales bacterium]
MSLDVLCTPASASIRFAAPVVLLLVGGTSHLGIVEVTGEYKPQV